MANSDTLDKILINLLLTGIFVTSVFLVLLGTTSEKINRGVYCGTTKQILVDDSKISDSSYILSSTNKVIRQSYELEEQKSSLFYDICARVNSTNSTRMLFYINNETVGETYLATGLDTYCVNTQIPSFGDIGLSCGDCGATGSINIQRYLLSQNREVIISETTAGDTETVVKTNLPLGISIFSYDDCRERVGWYLRNFSVIIGAILLGILIIIGYSYMQKKLFDELMDDLR